MQILGYLNGGLGEVEAWRVEVWQNEATIFEQKIRALAAALEPEDLELRESARTTLRGFIDLIVNPPGDGLLQVVGNLGEMLTAAGAPRKATAVGNGGMEGSSIIEFWRPARPTWSTRSNRSGDTSGTPPSVLARGTLCARCSRATMCWR
jgi:hypothetical protein